MLKLLSNPSITISNSIHFKLISNSISIVPAITPSLSTFKYNSNRFSNRIFSTQSPAAAAPSASATASTAKVTTTTAPRSTAAAVSNIKPTPAIQRAAESNAPKTVTTASGIAEHEEYSHPSVDLGNNYCLPHPIWEPQYLDSVKSTHRPIVDRVDSAAYWVIQTIRFNFDLMSGWSFLPKNEIRALRRIVFLETIAAIPGSIAATLRHLASLRQLRRDHGWIHTLLEEAENERMHLLSSIELLKPGPIMRAAIFASQGLFYNFFWISYMISPRFCHRLVGYLEEEAVKTYSSLIKAYDSGLFPSWSNKTIKVPQIAIDYWQLPADTATLRDWLLVIRADESHHRDVNHTFAELKPNQLNPFKPGH